MLALREQKRRTTQEKASLKINTHINYQGIFYAVLIFELLYVCTKSKRATWAGQITQSEQVYSALESGVVMFRLFVLCTFRFRKKYSKRSKKWTVQLRSWFDGEDFPERTLGHLSQHVRLSADDLRRISSTIATVPAPSLEKLVAERMQRM